MNHNATIIDSMFYCLTEEELFDHSLITRGLADIKKHGFDSIYLEYRNTRCPASTPRWQKAVAHLCKTAHRMGLRLYPATPHFLFSDELVRNHPEAFSDALLPMRTTLTKGAFELRIPTNSDALHFSIESVWFVNETRPSYAVAATDITRSVTIIEKKYEGGGCAMTDKRGPGVLTLCGQVSGGKSGKALFLVRKRRDYSACDIGHPVVRRYVDKAMALFDGLPISGMAWDEPQFGFAFWPDNGRAINERIYAAFKKRFGYDLKARLVDLWYDVKGRKSALTRYHYAELLESDLAVFENYFYRQCNARFAPNTPFVGIHRTMHEELADDFLIGCADYFRHNKSTSGGFTDSIFERDDSMLTLLSLARSMAPLTPTKLAFNNSWGFLPTEEHHDFYLSLMGAMNVRWIGHAYRSSYMFGPGYPDHPLWKTIKPHVDEHRKLVRFLDGATPWADTAVLYNWAAPGAYADNYMQLHRRNLLILGRTLAELNVQHLIVSPELLAKASISGQSFNLETGTFKRLIIPWAELLDTKVLTVIEKLATAGVEILMFGPPASMSTDGADISRRFATLAGIRPTGPQDYERVNSGHKVTLWGKNFLLNPDKLVAKYRSNPKQTYPDHFRIFAVKPTAKATPTLRSGKTILGTQNGSVHYIAAEVPHYIGLMKALLPKAGLKAPANSMVFAYQRGKQALIAGVGIWNKTVSGTVEWNGTRTSIKPCKSFSCKMRNGDSAQ